MEASNRGGLESLVEQLSEAAEAATEATLGLGLADLCRPKSLREMLDRLDLTEGEGDAARLAELDLVEKFSSGESAPRLLLFLALLWPPFGTLGGFLDLSIGRITSPRLPSSSSPLPVRGLPRPTPRSA